MFLIGMCASLSCAFAFQAEPPAGTGDSSADPTGRVIVLDLDITDVDEFVLDVGDTLVVHENRTIRVNKRLVLRGQVRVELPEDATQGAWAPQLNLGAGECIVITGSMTFGDGRDGIDPFVMGGAGASLGMHAPLIAIGVQQLLMGNGGDGGPGAEGGPGGRAWSAGWTLAFRPEALILSGGDGGDGGDGPVGVKFHPRGFPGGDGGDGGYVNQSNSVGVFKTEELSEHIETAMVIDPDRSRAELSAHRLLFKYIETAIGIDPDLDPILIGVHRVQPFPVEAHGGDGGDGGNGGPPFEPMAIEAGGGRAGNGGNGGYAFGTWGLPGTDVTPQDAPREGMKWTGGRGARGGEAYGGRGGNGGDAGAPPGGYTNQSNKGGRGGAGGRAIGGRGGAPGHVDPPPRYSLFAGQAGLGGRGVGGQGGNGGNGHNGGDGGAGGSSQNGESGDEPLNVPPRQQNSAD